MLKEFIQGYPIQLVGIIQFRLFLFGLINGFLCRPHHAASVKQKFGSIIVEDISGAALFSTSVHLLLLVVLINCSANLISRSCFQIRFEELLVLSLYFETLSCIVLNTCMQYVLLVVISSQSPEFLTRGVKGVWILPNLSQNPNHHKNKNICTHACTTSLNAACQTCRLSSLCLLLP